MTRTTLLLSALIAFTSLTPAFAQDKAAVAEQPVKKEEPKKEEAKKEAPKKADIKKTEAKKDDTKKPEKTESVLKTEAPAKQENTPLKKWVDAENALIDPLSAKEQESFLLIRRKHAIIKAVGIVERDVQNGIKSCGKNNPDMKDKMDARFDQWKNAVDPIIDTARKTFDQDLKNQKIVDEGKARKVLKLHDEAYEYGEKQVQKQPVSSKEACEGLLASMDRTEDTMIQLLQQTLLPESVIRQRGEQAEKARQKESSSKKPSEKPAEKTPDKKAE